MGDDSESGLILSGWWSSGGVGEFLNVSSMDLLGRGTAVARR